MSIIIARVQSDVCANILVNELNTEYGGTPVVENIRIDDDVNLSISYDTTPNAAQLIQLDKVLSAHDCSTVDDDSTAGDNITGYIFNDSGLDIPNGCPVTLTGFNVTHQVPTIAKADSSNVLLMPAIGCTTTTIKNNTLSTIVTGGQLTNIDTSLFSVGDELFVAPGGGCVNSKPIGPNLIQKMAEVEYVHAINGRSQVFGAGRINDIPNLTQNKVWMGDTNGVAQETDIYTENQVDQLLTNKANVSHTHISSDITDLTTGCLGIFQAMFHYDDYAANRWLEHVQNRASNSTPFVVPYNSKLISITFSNAYNSRETDVLLYRATQTQGNDATLIHTFAVRNARIARQSIITPDVTFAAGDKVGIYLKDRGSNTYDPMVMLYFERTDTLESDFTEDYSSNFD